MENTAMRNPEWVDKMSQLIEEIKSGKINPQSKLREEKPVPKEKIVLSAKEDGLLWFEMLKTLSNIKIKNEIISFPNCFEKICSKFSLKKAKAWNCLFFLAEFGLIEIISCHGIKLNYEIKES